MRLIDRFLKVFFLSIVSIFLIYAFANENTHLEHVSLKLKWKYQFQFAGFIAAKEKGFFKDVGLDVMLNEYNINDDIVKEVLDGTSTFGVSDSSLVLDALNGKEVRAMMAIFEHSPYILLGLKSSGIKYLKDLNGKTIALDKKANSNALLAMLKAYNIKYKKHDYVFNFDKLLSKEVDMLTGYISNEPHEAKEQKLDIVMFNPKDYGFDSYGDILFTSKVTEKMNPALVEKMYKASKKGWEYAFEHIDELVDIIYNKYNTLNKSKKALTAEAISLKKLIAIEDKFGEIKKEKLKVTARLFSFVLDKKYDTKNLDQFILNFENSHLRLSLKEKDFLKQHPILTVHNELGWEPFNFNHNGKPQGFSIDYMNLIAQKLGIKVSYISGPSWNQFLQMMKNKKLDLMLNIVKTEDRSKYLTFTSIYKDMGHVIFSKKNKPYHSLEELKGKSLAVPKGFFQQEMIEKSYPDIKLDLYENIEKCLKAVSFGKSDATVTLIPVAQKLMFKNSITNLEPTGDATYPSGKENKVQLRIATHKDNELLKSIIQKGMNEISYEEVINLEKKWFQEDSFKNSVTLTSKESEFLEKHPIIRVHNEKSWEPFNFNEAGVPRGFSIDYMNLVAKKAGFKIEYITGPSWNEFLDMTKSGQLDVMLNIVQTDQREKFLNFTKNSYINTTRAIIKRGDDERINGFKDLLGKTVSVEKGFFYEDYLSKNYPKINLLPLKNTKETLQAVASGKADATIGVMSVELYLMKKYFLSNLTYILDPSIDLLQAYGQKIAVRKDWPELVPILEKAMDKITYEELSKISSKWIENLNNKGNNINFSEEEKLYISKTKSIKVASMNNYYPYSFYSESRAKGISADILREIEKFTGIEIEFVPGIWSKNLENFKNKKVDLIDSISYNEQREKYTLFTKPYHKIPMILFNSNIKKEYKGISTLFGKTVGIAKSSFHKKELSKYKEIEIVEYDTVAQRMQDLAYGKIDFAIANLASANKVINDFGLSNINILDEFKVAGIDKEDLRYGIRKDKPVLYSIFEKVLNHIKDKEEQTIKEKWLGVNYLNKRDKIEHKLLNDEEKMFLQKHNNTFNLCIENNSLPFEGYDRTYQGIYADIAREISNSTKIGFNTVLLINNSSHTRAVKNGICDLSFTVSNTLKKDEELSYSEPFWSSKMVIVTNSKYPFIESVKDLKNKKIGYVQDKENLQFIKEKSRYKFFEYATLSELLVDLSAGKIDAYIGSLPAISYEIRKLGILNLKIAATTSYTANSVAIITGKYPLLQDIINKALVQIDEDTKNTIRAKWVDVNVEKGMDKDMVYKIAFAILLILLFLFFRQLQLKRFTTSIEKKNQELSLALDQLKKTQAQLIESEKMASLGNLVAGVAHEINTPLGVAYTTVTALTSIQNKIENEIKQSNNENLDKYYKKLSSGFTMIESNLKRSAELIQSFKRISVSQHSDQLSKIQINIFLQDLVKSLKYEYQKYGHEITLPHGKDLYISTYSGALAQVITNLIINSVKHGFKNKKNKQITLDVFKKGDGLELHYYDNGIGISKEIEKKIYDPFFTTDRKDGSGLGMNLVYNLVTQKLKGEIKLVYDTQEGVHFILNLPNLKENNIT